LPWIRRARPNPYMDPKSKARTLEFPTCSVRFETIVLRVTSALPSRRHREVLSLRLPPGLPAAPNTYRGSVNAPFASVRQLLDLVDQRPRNSSVPPDGPSKRQAGPERTAHQRRCGVTVVFPVRGQLGGRAAVRKRQRILGNLSSYSGCCAVGQSKPARSGTVPHFTIAFADLMRQSNAPAAGRDV
jgi:hypothetical protein